MNIPLEKYAKIKYNYCIACYSLSIEVLNEIIKARSSIEKTFPGLQIYIACDDSLFKNEERTIPRSEVKLWKDKLAYYREINSIEELN